MEIRRREILGCVETTWRLWCCLLCGRNRERRNNMSPSSSTVPQYCSIHTKNTVHTTAPTKGAADTHVCCLRCLRSRYSWRLIALGICELQSAANRHTLCTFNIYSSQQQHQHHKVRQKYVHTTACKQLQQVQRVYICWYC